MKKKVVVIGAGPAGMAAALGAYENGIAPDDILLIERDYELGGILNQCIHAGFGLHYFGEELTGTEYADRFINQIKEKKIEYILNSTVLSMSNDKEITVVSPSVGYTKIEAEAVILAMGCRERPRGSLNIAGTRPEGIMSAGTAQKFVNIDGYLPGKNVVILGSGDIGLIMARRMTLEGAKVLCVCEIMPQSGGLKRNIVQCLDDFNIPLYLSTTVTQILGKDRIEGVVISKVDENLKPIKGTEKILKCDTLLLSCGLIPENEISKTAGIQLDKITGGAIVNQLCETSIDGVFACGNVLHVHDVVDFVTEESKNAGKSAADFVLGKIKKTPAEAKVKAGKNVRYVLPQKIVELDNAQKGIDFSFRVRKSLNNAEIKVKIGDEQVYCKKKKEIAPGEMQKIALDAQSIRKAIDYKSLEIFVEGEDTI